MNTTPEHLAALRTLLDAGANPSEPHDPTTYLLARLVTAVDALTAEVACLTAEAMALRGERAS